MIRTPTLVITGSEEPFTFKKCPITHLDSYVLVASHLQSCTGLWLKGAGRHGSKNRGFGFSTSIRVATYIVITRSTAAQPEGSRRWELWATNLNKPENVNMVCLVICKWQFRNHFLYTLAGLWCPGKASWQCLAGRGRCLPPCYGVKVEVTVYLTFKIRLLGFWNIDKFFKFFTVELII